MPNGQYPVLLAGGDFTSGTVQAFSPFRAWKTIATSRSSATALTADPDLSLAVVANATYEFSAWLEYTTTAATQGFSWEFTVPTGSSGGYTAVFYNTSGTFESQAQTWATNYNAFANNVTTSVLCTGTLFTGSTAGSLTLEWAQQTSSATALTLNVGSKIRLERAA